MAYEFSKRHEVTTVARSKRANLQLDVTDFPAVEKTVAKEMPDIVVNAVKPPISTDKMQEHADIARTLNVDFPGVLAKLQSQHGYMLLHMSTDWVYEGLEGTVYDETCPVFAPNYYTETKLEAERRILSTAQSFVIFRSEGIYGLDERGTNLYLRLKDSSTTGKPVRLASDQFSQHICGAELARVSRAIVEKGATGIFNLVGHEYMSRLEFAKRVCSFFGFKANIQSYSISERGMSIPAHLKLDVSKAEAVAGRIKSLQEQFTDLRRLEEEHGH